MIGVLCVDNVSVLVRLFDYYSHSPVNLDEHTIAKEKTNPSRMRARKHTSTTLGAFAKMQNKILIFVVCFFFVRSLNTFKHLRKQILLNFDWFEQILQSAAL